METDIKKFFLKIIQIVTAIISWAIITMFFGLYLECGFIYGHFNTFNAIFYTWFIASLFMIGFYIYKAWKKY